MSDRGELALEAPIQRRSLHAELTTRLREMIVDGRLRPGAKVSERDLCAHLGVSRTPLREALKVLASEGLVALTPNRGAFVSPLTREAMAEIFPIIGALEGLAGALACQRVTSEELTMVEGLHAEMVAHYEAGDLSGYFKCNQAIHLAILVASRNATLLAAHGSLSDRVRRERYLVNLSPQRWRKAVQEHERILEALRARDADALSALLRAHFDGKLKAALTHDFGEPEAHPPERQDR